MTAEVVALYRYPVKGFTPERCERLTVLPSDRVAGDRVLAIRFADAPVGPDDWCRKYNGVVLANTPGIARLLTTFDHERLRLRIAEGDAVVVDESLEPGGRQRIVDAITEYVLGLSVNPLRDHPERLPLRLVGDGLTPRYQDNEGGQITLHSRASLAAVAAAIGDADLSETRFRSNIAIDGVDAWAEQGWMERDLHIGAAALSVVKPKVRCLATHANPDSGDYDQPVMQTLVRAFGQKEPTFGIGMLSRGRSGEIRVGDSLTPPA